MKIRRFVAAAALGIGLTVGSAPVLADVVAAAPTAVSAQTVLAGQFCKAVDVGKVVTADNGKTVKCVNEGRYNRWVVK